jgi:GGDEF domain-containing protein
MLQNKGQEEKNTQSLPRQDAPPTVEQLRHIQSEAARSGRVQQLPFGKVPDDYLLKVMHDKHTAAFKWRLERPSKGLIEWDEGNRDPQEIYSLIIRRTLMPAQSASEQFRTLRTKVHKPTLEGELQDMPMPNLVQSIQMNKGTGRLEIESSSGEAFIYFIQGDPVHCVFNDSEGDEGVLELMSVTQGNFRFFKEPKCNDKTVTKNLQLLLMEGAALTDHLAFLQNIGVGLETYLIRNHSTMSETLFEQMVKDGCGSPMDLQKRFYQEVDNQSTILEILRRVPLSKSRWVPIVFNLISCGLCSYRDKVPDLGAVSRDATIDWSQVKRVESVLRRPDTGVYTYPAFLLFLEKEFFRYERFKTKFAVVTLDIKVRRKDSIEPLPLEALQEVIARINKLIRRTDMLFHYETLGFAILMPETGHESAKTFALRLAEILMSKHLANEKGSYPIVASAGFAAIPDSCESLGALMALAQSPSR